LGGRRARARAGLFGDEVGERQDVLPEGGVLSEPVAGKVVEPEDGERPDGDHQEGDGEADAKELAQSLRDAMPDSLDTSKSDIGRCRWRSLRFVHGDVIVLSGIVERPGVQNQRARRPPDAGATTRQASLCASVVSRGHPAAASPSPASPTLTLSAGRYPRIGSDALESSPDHGPAGAAAAATTTTPR
jgi:hypothetical protein